MTHICTACGHQAKPKRHTSGSFFIELILWIIMFIISLGTSFILMLIPILYTVYRATSTKKVCALCKSPNIIPIDSPNGKALVEKQANQ